MKYIHMSVIAMSFNVNAAMIEYQLEQDNVVDGVISGESMKMLKVKNQKNVFSGHTDSSVIRGSYSEKKNIISFDITSKDKTSYYLGVKHNKGDYKGSWYDSNGNGGDFNLASDSTEDVSCMAATKTGWHNGLYCNADIDGGGWHLVAVRAEAKFGTGYAVDKITSITESQYLNREKWVNMKKNMKEILFVQNNTGIWGIMNIAAASYPKLCKPLTDNLNERVIVHDEAFNCDLTGMDYTVAGHSHSPDYQGSLYWYFSPSLWTKTSGLNAGSAQYSDRLMVYVR